MTSSCGTRSFRQVPNQSSIARSPIPEPPILLLCVMSPLSTSACHVVSIASANRRPSSGSPQRNKCQPPSACQSPQIDRRVRLVRLDHGASLVDHRMRRAQSCHGWFRRGVGSCGKGSGPPCCESLRLTEKKPTGPDLDWVSEQIRNQGQTRTYIRGKRGVFAQPQSSTTYLNETSPAASPRPPVLLLVGSTLAACKPPPVVAAPEELVQCRYFICLRPSGNSRGGLLPVRLYTTTRVAALPIVVTTLFRRQPSDANSADAQLLGSGWYR
ncbi:hypothetical protein QBC41DRAFT_9774 [Cercophora samala]|uniref:Uncharacterized protein n=1 Tax=Cercophora samala TaxID=330535 RepID=A0AA39Z7U3_9PEZI|nr:hypothetical protein QBC41DRAFT_9774 [Cercophora samala]